MSVSESCYATFELLGLIYRGVVNFMLVLVATVCGSSMEMFLLFSLPTFIHMSWGKTTHPLQNITFLCRSGFKRRLKTLQRSAWRVIVSYKTGSFNAAKTANDV